MTNHPWYDAYIAVESKHKEDCQHFKTSNPNDKDVTVGGDNDSSEIDQESHQASYSCREISELRDEAFAIQQQLTAYHKLIDEREELKTQNKQFEQQVTDIVEKNKQIKKMMKRNAHDQLQSLKDEIIELKLKIANSRGQEDYDSAEMLSMIKVKKSLEERIKLLRQEKRICALNTYDCESPFKITVDSFQKDRSGFLSIFGQSVLPSTIGNEVMVKDNVPETSAVLT